MTVDQLKQYKKKKNTIKLIDEKINELHYKYDEFLFDTVVGSTPARPYPHVIPIQGYGSTSNSSVQKRLSDLERRKKNLCAELEEIEAFVNTISDNEVWQIIQLKYLGDRDISWATVARKLYDYPCGDRVRKKFTRFFEIN